MSDTATIVRPTRVWRTIRGQASGYKVAYYDSQENRDKAAQKWANKDQDPVLCEEWTEEVARTCDPINKGWSTDKTVDPACICETGLRKVYICGAPVHEKTGYCLTHQHVYRRENGIPEPERQKPVDPRTPERKAQDLRDCILQWFNENPAGLGEVRTEEQIFGGLVSIVAITGWDNFRDLSWVDQAILTLYKPVVETPDPNGVDGETCDWYVMPTVLYQVLTWNLDAQTLFLEHDWCDSFTVPGSPTPEQVRQHAEQFLITDG